MFKKLRDKAWANYRNLARPWEEAAADIATDIATDVSSKASRKAAEKSLDESLDMMYSVPGKMIERGRKMAEEAGAFSIYIAKGGYKTEFKLAQQRMSARADDLAKERQAQVKSKAPTQKK